MKLTNILSVATLSILMSTTMAVSSAELSIKVTDINIQQGHLLVVLYDSEEAFDNKGKSLQMSRIQVTEQSHNLTFKGLEAGTYAVKMFHDENDNGKLDTNLVGIPSEGYGFSNNAGSMGPASFKDASFSITDNSEISIKLR